MNWGQKSAAALAACAAMAIAGAGSARAGAITEDFSVSESSAALASRGDGLFSTTSFAEFNPALGTLTSVTVTLTGDFAVTFTGLPDESVDLTLDYHGLNEEVGGQGGFSASTSPVTGDLDIDTTDMIPFDLDLLEGTGTTEFDLMVSSSGGGGIAFSTTDDDGLQGTITYNYTPAATGVPEPASLSLLGGGLAALALARRRRRATS